MENINNKANFRIIQIVYGTLIGGVILFLLVTISSVSKMHFSYLDESAFQYIVPAFFIAGLFLSPFLYNKTMSKIKESDSLFSKLTIYQGANIMRGAPLEAAGLMGLAGFMITNNMYYLIYMFIALVLMFLYFPTKYKFANAVALSMEEQNKLNEL